MHSPHPHALLKIVWRQHASGGSARETAHAFPLRVMQSSDIKLQSICGSIRDRQIPTEIDSSSLDVDRA